MQIIPKRENYDLVDFKKEEFPIQYNEEDFPKGFRSLEILYDQNGKPHRIYLYGSVDSVMDIKDSSQIEKILGFIEDRLEEQAIFKINK